PIRAARIKAVEDFPLSPAGRDRVGPIAVYGSGERVDKFLAGVRVRGFVNQDIGTRRDAAGLLDIDRGLNRPGGVARRARAAVNLNLGDAIRIDVQTHCAPIGVRVALREAGERDNGQSSTPAGYAT